MSLLLTVLSVLALCTLLMLLAVGLLLILKPLQGVRQHLEKVAMGVRAIEQQTAPLEAGAAKLGDSLDQAAGAAAGAADRLAEADRQLEAAGPALRVPP